MCIALEMALTTLPGNTTKDGHTCLLQAAVVIGNNQLHTAQATPYQALQKGTLVDFLLAQGDGNAQRFPIAL